MSEPHRPLPAPLMDSPPEGWQRRFLATEPRLSEAVKAYRELGLEVVLVPALRDTISDQECKECLDDTFGIYTRPAQNGDSV